MKIIIFLKTMPRRKKEDQPQEEIKKIKTPQLVEGMRDILPADEKYWNFVQDKIRSVLNDYSFKMMNTPVVEKYELFNHTLFKQYGTLEREAFYFIDHGQKLILRPEATSSIARAFVEHNMNNQTPPIKVYNWGPMFRQGRIDDNKLRQFTQVSFEIFGESAAAIDAELIIIGYFLLKNLGLEAEVVLNSVGCLVCRLEYSKALGGYLKSKRSALCADCRKRINKDPLKFLTCENSKCQRFKEDAPQTVDWLCDDCRNHLFHVLEYLDQLKIPYRLDSNLIRTFDYYNKTVFEIVSQVEGQEKISLIAGGRYDYLTEMLGGSRVPAAGMAIGLERLINQLKNSKIEIPTAAAVDIYFAQIGEQARQKSFAFYEELRKEEFSVKANFSKGNLKAQLDSAIKLKAKYVLILGQKEVAEGTIILRDLDSGIQEVVNITKVIKELRKRLSEPAHYA